MLEREYVNASGQHDIHSEIIGNNLQATNLFYVLISKGMAPYGISKSQFDILAFIHYFDHQGAITLTEISRVMHLSKANVSGILTRLESKGLIYFQQCPQDARVRQICLADRGSEILNKTLPIYSKIIDQVMSAFSDREREQLSALLKKLCFGLNKYRSDFDFKK